MRLALDRLADSWREPALHIHWRLPTAAAGAAAAATSAAVCAKTLAATVELRAMWTERAAGAAPRQRVGWALGLSLQEGQLRPHYVGGCDCALDCRALFPPDALEGICAAEATHGLAALVPLLGVGMRELLFFALGAEARRLGHQADALLLGGGLLLRRRQPAALDEVSVRDLGREARRREEEASAPPPAPPCASLRPPAPPCARSLTPQARPRRFTPSRRAEAAASRRRGCVWTTCRAPETARRRCR